MRRLTSLLIIITLSVSLSACAKLKHFFHRPAPHIVNKTYSLNGVSNLNIEEAHIVYINGSRKNNVVVASYSNNVPKTSLNRKTHTLTISNGDPSAVITINKSAWNDIRLEQAQKVVINSPHNISANTLAIYNSRNITFNAKRTIRFNTLQFTHAGIVTIHGPVRTHALIVNGKTNLDPHRLHFNVLYQGNGVNVVYPTLYRKKLEINAAGNTKLRLQGHVDTLKINLYQNAQLLAPKLVVQNAYIKAHGNSFARLTVRHKLFMYNTRQAVIEYYGKPKIYRRILNGSAGIPMSLRGVLAP